MALAGCCWRSEGFLGGRAARLLIAIVLSLTCGCAASRDLDDRPAAIASRDEPCQPGEVRACGRTLGSHAGLVSCLFGEQRCQAGAWGTCDEGEVVSVVSNASVAPGPTLLSLSEAEECEFSPCDPYCRNFLEQPDSGAVQTVIAGGTSGIGWTTGSLASFPNGLVNKGLAEVCSDGSDCQFNRYCRFPASGTCSHNKCATGDALSDGCDPCVSEICDQSPECCTQAAAACEHDPCAVGGELDADCSPCVQAICALMPECCSDEWDATCVAAVAGVCERSCGCCAGEQGFAGHCYALETDTESWSQARNACVDRTASGDWNLVSIGDQDENDFIEGWNGDDDTWIGLEQGDGATEDQWRWTNGDPPGPWLESTGSGMFDNFASDEPNGSDDCTRMNADENGTWDATTCSNDYNWICEGPPECIAGVPPPPAACEHDPCVAGAPLADTCDPCVAAICDQMPSCCSTSWNAACIAEVADTCGHSCACLADEEQYAGRCYRKEESNKSWSAARTSCQAWGAGWDLAGISDSAENNFLNTQVIDTDETWIGFNDSTLEGTWQWASGDPAGSYVSSGTVTNTALAYGGTWRYLANNTAPAASWNTVAFADGGWPSGTAQLGFGDGDEATSFAKNGPTYYFRRTFTLAQLPTAASLSVLFDDGYVAYVNGVELARENVTNTAHNQYATASAENQTETTNTSTTPFVVGTNVLAVMVKMRNAGDGDLSFNAQLVVTVPATPGGIYQAFASGQPNADGDCVRYAASQTGTWHDADCSLTRDSACEGPAMMFETGATIISGLGPKLAIPKGDVWRYQASGVSPGSGWETIAFDDTAWSAGRAELGFGDGDEETLLSDNGPSYYFRRRLALENVVTAATLAVTIDDGFVAYVNGSEVMRHNSTSTSHAQSASASSSDNEVVGGAIDPAAFLVGENVVAVMVKNASGSSDVSFDLRLDLTLEQEQPLEVAWGEQCVAQVSSVCDAICDTDDPPLGTGICAPWYPNETDPNCAGVDLALGVPCDDTLPVCNHGNSEAPAGVRIVSYPANSGHFPLCDPDPDHPGIEECFTDQPIEPGSCINLTNCAGLSGNREVMVNPPGDDHVEECSCRDNWTIYSGGECMVPACSGGTGVATQTTKPVDIIVLIDNSGSMAGEIEAVQDRINEDFSAILSAAQIDYRVIMMSRFGDVDVGVGGSDHPICIGPPLGGNACLDADNELLVNNPPVFYHFSTDIGSLDAWCRVLEGWDNPDEIAADSRPWTAVAPNGLQELLRVGAYKEFLVITDDRINCTYGVHDYDDLNSVSTGAAEAAEFDAALLTLSSEHFGTLQKRNYTWHSILGMAANNPSTTPWPPESPATTAKCSPGSVAAGTGHQALSILTGGLRYPVCQNADFDAMFQALATQVIEGAQLPCSYELSNVDQSNPELTTVAFAPGDGGGEIPFAKVDGVDDCSDEEYYYEDEDTVVLCPDACEIVQDDPGGRVSVEVACAAFGYETETYSQRYEAVCPEGSRPQWGFFAYESETPGDSSIVFRARQALSEDELADDQPQDWATASADLDTQVCSMSGPSPCPIDIWETVGGPPEVNYPWLELEMVFNPTSDSQYSPSLFDWRFTYSCVPSE